MTFIAENQCNEEFHRKIVDGPSKFDLMLALFDRDFHRKLEFSLDEGISDAHTNARDAISGRQHQLSITGVSAEDGSGESWNITGSVTFYVRFQGKYLRDSHRSFRAYFGTNTRKGWIVISPEGK